MIHAKLTGLAPEFAKVNVNISRPTILGRNPPDINGQRKLTPKVDRYLPENLHGTHVDSIMTFGPGTDATSRNHALIYPAGDRFMLTDLGATNGTYYSFMDETRRIFYGATYLLRDGDVIHLGNPYGGIRFRIEYASVQPPAPAYVKPPLASIELEEPQPGPQLIEPLAPAIQNYALLVGNQSNLQGVHNDISAMKRTLESRRGFRGNIETLLDAQTDHNSVVERLQVIERSATPESLTVFYFSGHGRRGGDLDINDKMKMSPADLYDHLDWIRGRKAVIIDACHSGHFAEESIIPPETIVIASTRDNDLAYEGDVGSGKKMGYLTRALTKIINSSQQRLNLKLLQAQLGSDVKLAQKGQEPQVVGATIYVGTQTISVELLKLLE